MGSLRFLFCALLQDASRPGSDFSSRAGLAGLGSGAGAGKQPDVAVGSTPPRSPTSNPVPRTFSSAHEPCLSPLCSANFGAFVEGGRE